MPYSSTKTKTHKHKKQNLDFFHPISLSELNATARFLDRIDTKYILSFNQLEELLPLFAKEFYILQIANHRIFSYDNVYMDTDDLMFYYQHERWVKPRMKVRSRCYVESNLSFFEIKHKANGITRKFRYQRDAGDHGKMTKSAKRFFSGVYQTLCDKNPPEIQPVMRTNYNRITLVHMHSAERITIDFNIETTSLIGKNIKQVNMGDVVILESKSSKKRGPSWEIMKKFKIRSAKGCSKYALGIAYSWLADAFLHFLPTMKKIEKISSPQITSLKELPKIKCPNK